MHGGDLGTDPLRFSPNFAQMLGRSNEEHMQLLSKIGSQGAELCGPKVRKIAIFGHFQNLSPPWGQGVSGSFLHENFFGPSSKNLHDGFLI